MLPSFHSEHADPSSLHYCSPGLYWFALSTSIAALLVIFFFKRNPFPCIVIKGNLRWEGPPCLKEHLITQGECACESMRALGPVQEKQMPNSRIMLLIYELNISELHLVADVVSNAMSWHVCSFRRILTFRKRSNNRMSRKRTSASPVS
jgi:hypothetical protein